MAEPPVLLPGMMCDARVWATQLTVLSYERPVTIAPVCAGDRIEEIASGLLSSLPAKFALCGHGMGGAIALELFRRAPERVIRLALIGTNPLSDTPQEGRCQRTRETGLFGNTAHHQCGGRVGQARSRRDDNHRIGTAIGYRRWA